MIANRLEVVPVEGVPAIVDGDDLAAQLLEALAGAGSSLHDGDIAVITSKVVSKAEGRVIAADDREQAISDEAVEVVAERGATRIVRTRHGLVLAAAGVDASNTESGTVLLLPIDPDASARRIRTALQAATGVRLGVVITDTAGRPWRDGLVDIAIGAAGVLVLDDHRGRVDDQGRTLEMTVTCVADQVASAAELVKGKTSGRPFAVVRGMAHAVTHEDGPGATAVVRPLDSDLFRRGARESLEEGLRAAVANRRTVRQWTDEPVDRQVVLDAIEAAITAPAPHHTTPWRFVLIDEPAVRTRLLDAMAQQWTRDLAADGFDDDAIKRRVRRGDLLRQAPTLLLPVLVAEGAHTYPDDRRAQAERAMFLLSMGAAAEALMVRLAADGWGSAWVSSTLFCADVVGEVLRWPSDWEPMGAIAIGRPVASATARLRRDPEDYLHVH